MNKLNIKRCLHKIGFFWVFLCASLGATAQGMDAAEKVIHPPATAASEVVANAEPILEQVKADESKTQEPAAKVSVDNRIIGLTSFYAAKFHGKRTASGEKFSSKLLTAAHLTFPFGTLLMVTNPRNNQSVIVRVNDRGPHTRGRLLDISRAAAERLGITRRGVAQVEIEVLKP